jgi:molybdenum cofactor biosynthesis protein MoaC
MSDASDHNGNMRDISNQPRSLRRGIATARLAIDAATMARLKAGDLPQGDPLPVARIAALQAAKATSQLIPHCHPLPIDYVGVAFTVADTYIDIDVEVKAIHRTGVEMEALTAASIAALTIYDLLKAVGGTMEITHVAVKKKTGGKSQRQAPDHAVRAGVLVLSDGVSAGERTDSSGEVIRTRLVGLGVTIEQFAVKPDDFVAAQALLRDWCDHLKLDLVVVTGGTGLGPRDVAPEIMDSLLERRLSGVEEAMRAYGQERVPTAMLSRSRAGQRGRTLLLALPGSPKGVAESLDAILPMVLHAIPMMAGGNHG